jgi:purine-binding chemotaxis protein CheW
MGIISVRGQIITVVDLRRRLNLAAEQVSARTRILLVDAASGETFGLLVDEVLQVHHLTEAEIEHTSAALGNDVAEHIAGIARPAKASAPNKHMAADQMIILLDVKVVLSDAT